MDSEDFMGLFDKLKKKEKKEGVLKQDLDIKEENNQVFIMHLLMKEKVEMPEKEKTIQVMKKHLGDIDCYNHDEKNVGLALKDYQVELKEGVMPTILMIMACLPMDNFQIDTLNRSQMWDCPESSKILDECKYHVVAVDMMASLLPYKKRAELDMDYMEALVELFPECEAIYFQTSGKMFTREKIVNHQIPKEDRFIYFAVNARFFNIQGTNDYIVDTLGMNILGLPDLQYHFHDMNPNWIVNHAYNVASYIFGSEKIIGNGDYIDGIKEGRIDMNIQWQCHHENSLIQPLRPVIDVCMNEYASGNRNYNN